MATNSSPLICHFVSPNLPVSRFAMFSSVVMDQGFRAAAVIHIRALLRKRVCYVAARGYS